MKWKITNVPKQEHIKGLLDGLLGVGMIMKLVSQWFIPENSLRK